MVDFVFKTTGKTHTEREGGRGGRERKGERESYVTRVDLFEKVLI